MPEVTFKMDTPIILGLIGSFLLIIGVFTPLLSAPIIGDINYFQNGKGDGIYIVGLAVLSIACLLFRAFNGLWFTSVLSIALMGYTFMNLQSTITQLQKNASGLGVAMAQSVQMSWGWGILIIGAILVFAAPVSNLPNAQHKQQETHPLVAILTCILIVAGIISGLYYFTH